MGSPPPTRFYLVGQLTRDEGDEGNEGDVADKLAEGAVEDEGDEGAEVAERADRIDVAAIYIYIVTWLEHHGNRLYGVLRLLSKSLSGVDGDGDTP